jgi:hypothetical protein
MRDPMHRLALGSLAVVLAFVCACHRTEAAPPVASHPVDAAVAAAAALDPNDPASLSSATESSGEIDPSLTVTPTGVVAVAWTSRRPGKPSVIGARFSRDGGATWETMQAIAAPEDRASTDPVLASDSSGDVYLAWLGWRATDAGPTDSHVYVARAEAADGVFGAPVEVTDKMRHSTTVNRPWVAVTGTGNVLVTWAFASVNGDGVGIAQSTDGVKWTKGVVIERIDLHTKAPYVCTSPHGERAWVVYLDSEAGVRVRASDDGGLTWSPARVATVSAFEDRALVAQESPVCVGEGEQVTVAYARSRLANDAGAQTAASSVVVARSADGGRSFDDRKTYDAGALLVMYPQMAREPDGAIDLAFYASGATPETGALRWARTTEAKAGLPASKVVRDHFRFEPTREERAWPGGSFGWTLHEGTLYAASVDNTGELPHVVFTRTPSH